MDFFSSAQYLGQVYLRRDSGCWEERALLLVENYLFESLMGDELDPVGYACLSEAKLDLQTSKDLIQGAPPPHTLSLSHVIVKDLGKIHMRS